MADRPPFLIAIMGPTGAGKTHVAEKLADSIGAELLNADAFQIYRGFDIGTSKPKDAGRYHLINIRGPKESFGAGEFCSLSMQILESAFERGRDVVVVGGTGFYVRALFEEYENMKSEPDPALRQMLMKQEREKGVEFMAAELIRLQPDAAEMVDAKNPVRVRRALERALTLAGTIEVKLPAFKKAKFVLNWNTEQLDARLSRRVDEMFDEGWSAEVAGLLEAGVTKDVPAMRAIGYHNIIELLEGKVAESEARAQITLNTRQYAKRQRTWLRSEPNVVGIDLDGDQGLKGAHDEVVKHLI